MNSFKALAALHTFLSLLRSPQTFLGVRSPPLPRHSFFFLLSSQLSRQTRAETLATQATLHISR